MNISQVLLCMHDGAIVKSKKEHSPFCPFCGSHLSLRPIASIGIGNLPKRLFLNNFDATNIIFIKNAKFCLDCGEIQEIKNSVNCQKCGSDKLKPLA